MLRLLAFLIVTLGLGLGFSWLADRPGDVAIVWMGTEVRFSVMALAVGLLTLIVGSVLVWSLLVGLVRTPASVGSFFHRRRRERGWQALSRGMIAIGAGDVAGANRDAQDARRILGDEPLALLLEAQTAQASGDFASARNTFERMRADPATKLLGLRGLYIEATREAEAEAARQFAEEASLAAPKLGWAGTALIDFQAQAGEWDAALVTLERNARNRIVDKAAAKRLKAVLLTARAMTLEEGDPDLARSAAVEAHGLAPDLVPAALVAARLLVRAGEFRKAARILESGWKQEPHPDIAEAYTHLRPGSSVQDRLARIRDLIKVRGHHPECALALARAELAARDFPAARASLKALVEAGATRRTCLAMAEIDEAEFGLGSRVREWLTRAVRAPRDPAWVADGHVFDHWLPVSPVSGHLDAFAWAVPPEKTDAVEGDVVERLSESVEVTVVPVPSPPAPASPPPAADPAPDLSGELIKAAPPPRDITPPKERRKPPVVVAAAGDAASKPRAATALHQPDDPGPVAVEETDENRIMPIRY